MKRSIALLLCLVLCFSAIALAEDAWTCPDCGTENTGLPCTVCGTAKPGEEVPETDAEPAADIFDRGYALYEAGDYEGAVPILKEAAEQGNKFAQFFLGLCFKQGLGTAQNYEEAAGWLQAAAEQGIMGAQYELVFLYFDGNGVSQDMEKAMQWFRLAAEQGHPDAMRAMSICYRSGCGVPMDQAEADRWDALYRQSNG